MASTRMYSSGACGRSPCPSPAKLNPRPVSSDWNSEAGQQPLYIGHVAVIRQGSELAASAGDGLDRFRDWLAGPPLEISSRQIDQAVSVIVDRLQSSAGDLAAGGWVGSGRSPPGWSLSSSWWC